MKKVTLSEEQLIDLIKSITERINEAEMEDSDFSTDVERTVLDPREKQLKGMFGKYKQYVPGDVLRHLRKNPQSIFNALYEIYGEEAYSYLDKASGK